MGIRGVPCRTVMAAVALVVVFGEFIFRPTCERENNIVCRVLREGPPVSAFLHPWIVCFEGCCPDYLKTFELFNRTV